MLALPTTTIDIDLEVHRAIEAQRTSFDQTHNQILRNILINNEYSEDIGPASPPDPEESPPTHARRVVKHRRTGSYKFSLLGESFEEPSLKGAYKKCLTQLSALDPRFLEKLSQRKTSARRIVARNPQDLFIKSPGLAKDFAERLEGEWWFDVNLSQEQVESRLRTACKVAEIMFGQDLTLEFPE